MIIPVHGLAKTNSKRGHGKGWKWGTGQKMVHLFENPWDYYAEEEIFFF